MFHKTTNGGSSWTLGNGGAQLDGNQILSIGVSSTSTDTIYVGTAPITSSAKLFRSTNGGTSFTNITGSLPDRYPDDIAVDPTNSKIVYTVFSGFGTSHLFKSTDAGNSWIDIGSSLPDVPSSAIVIDPNNTSNLFFGNDLGVYFSPDAGQTWFEYINGLPQASMILDLSIVRSSNRIRAVTHGNGIYEAAIDVTVPVELTSFSADVQNEKVILKWSTSTETNNNGFEVQRSFDGKSFATIGFVSGNGTTTETNNYSYIDENQSGKIYYRLKQLDYNGTYSYSNIISIDAITLNDFVLEQNFPNPFNPSTIIDLKIPIESFVTLKIYDVQGKEISTLINDLKQPGIYSFEFIPRNLSSGVYFYQLSSKTQNTGIEFSKTMKMLFIK